MKHLLDSSQPQKDRQTFMKAQVLFWLLGATDGHAKNFSVFISAYGRYQLTPLYDIISSYPAISKLIGGGKGFNKRELKLAMGLKATKGKKYHCEQIFPRHFLQTAKQVGFDEAEIQKILQHFYDELPGTIERVKSQLPDDFPVHTKGPILADVLRMRERLGAE